MEKFLQKIVDVLEYQSKPSIANQGQALDGYSALANYNEIAKEIKNYLKEQNPVKIVSEKEMKTRDKRNLGAFLAIKIMRWQPCDDYTGFRDEEGEFIDHDELDFFTDLNLAFKLGEIAFFRVGILRENDGSYTCTYLKTPAYSSGLIVQATNPAFAICLAVAREYGYYKSKETTNPQRDFNIDEDDYNDLHFGTEK